MDESENPNQEYDKEMAKQEIMPDVENEFKVAVDEMIKVEMENMKLL